MRRILSWSLLAITLAVNAQNPGSSDKAKENYTLSLDQAVSYALEHNYGIVNAGRDIKIAEKQKWETIAMGLPQINAGLDYLHNFELMRQGITGGGVFGGEPGQIITFAFGTDNTMNAHATVNQLLFDGSYIVALQA